MDWQRLSQRFASDKLGSVPEIDRAVSVAVPACGRQGLSISIKGEAADDAFVGDDRLMEMRLLVISPAE